eukprot:2752292-Prymnesium_polylepis.1
MVNNTTGMASGWGWRSVQRFAHERGPGPRGVALHSWCSDAVALPSRSSARAVVLAWTSDSRCALMRW